MQGPKNHANLRVDLFHRVLGVALNRTFGSSLVLRMCLLILLSLGVFAYGGYRLVVEPAINELALSQMSSVAQKVQARLESSFSGVETSLQSSRTWAENTQARPLGKQIPKRCSPAYQ